jgi:putative phage-type endonuclease
MVYSQICDWLSDFVDHGVELVDTWDCTEWINETEIITIFSDFVLPTYKTKKARTDALQILHALIWEFYQFKRAESLFMYKDDALAFDRIKNTQSVPQQSQQWLKEKCELLTASEFASILNEGATRLNVLREKLAKRTSVSSGIVCLSGKNGAIDPRSWGHRFEPIIRQIYSELTNKTVCSEIGRIKHPKLPRLAASPDGVISNGRLLEIKAPYSRKIIQEEIPYEYYCQMQVQMEVCDIGAVEYCECVFKTGSEFVALDISGCVAKYVGAVAVTGFMDDYTSWTYVYSPLFPDTEAGRAAALGWFPELEEGVSVLEKKVWQIADWQVVTVLRNPRWWLTVGYPAYVDFCTDLATAKADPMFLAPSDLTRSSTINYPLFIDEY